jgi:tRNA dimethylallyltransferase
MEPSAPPVVFVVGPTAVGKTVRALDLARLLGGEIVNADAFQLYRGLPTLTACPSPDERALVPHHLFEVLSPAETCDAGRYLELARPVLADLAGRGKAAVIVGGSGLYVKALTHGLEDTPPSDPELRARLDALSHGEILRLLSRIDPASLASLGPHNRRYLQRAVEITLTARNPASSLRRAWNQTPSGLRGVLLERPREELAERIARRVDAMLAGDAVREVAAVTAWSSTSSRAIGVREIQALRRGETGLEECAEAIRAATRRYAKRQLTWFRRERWLCPTPAAASSIEVARALGLW